MKILDLPVAFDGNLEEKTPGFFGIDENYRNLGGYTLTLKECQGGVSIRLTDYRLNRSTQIFAPTQVGLAEYKRLLSLLELRQKVMTILDIYLSNGLIPDEFMESIQEGNFESVGAAADYLQEQGKLREALMVRAIYHRVHGRPNVYEKIDNKSVAVMNTEVDMKGRPSETTGSPRVAIITPGVSIEIVSVNPNPVGRALDCRTFKVGDQAKYDSYNLVFYGPVLSITAKTVAVSKEGEMDSTKSVMKIAQFVRKNYNFDLASAKQRNENVYLHM